MVGGRGPHFVELIEKTYVGALRRESWRLRPPRFSKGAPALNTRPSGPEPRGCPYGPTIEDGRVPRG